MFEELEYRRGGENLVGEIERDEGGFSSEDVIGEYGAGCFGVAIDLK